jgi:hypothetical protein
MKLEGVTGDEPGRSCTESKSSPETLTPPPEPHCQRHSRDPRLVPAQGAAAAAADPGRGRRGWCGRGRLRGGGRGGSGPRDGGRRRRGRIGGDNFLAGDRVPDPAQAAPREPPPQDAEGGGAAGATSSPAIVFRIRLKQPPASLRHKMRRTAGATSSPAIVFRIRLMRVPELCRNFRSARLTRPRAAFACFLI